MTQHPFHTTATKAVSLLALCWLALLATSCRDSFDIDTLHNPSKLVVYCFPSTADTTYISVTNSLGVKKYADEHKITNLTAAQVTYEVNGVARPVELTPQGLFCVRGGHQPGDRIDIHASLEGYAPISATTTMPQPVAVELKSLKPVTEYDPLWGERRNFYQMQASFTDPADTQDYYAVRICLLKVGSEFSYTTYPEINVISEPLLKNTTTIDDDFGFENNFYGGFYIFSDQDINGQTYTLRLNVEQLRMREYNFKGQCRVELFRIAPEYYHFLKSINDVDNNDLALNGLAQLTPIYSNITGGLGVMAAYCQSASQWLQVDDDNE